MSANVTVKESIWIAAPIEAVWDYTQNYARRREWDDSILEAEVVRIHATGDVRRPIEMGLRWRRILALRRKGRRNLVDADEYFIHQAPNHLPAAATGLDVAAPQKHSPFDAEGKGCAGETTRPKPCEP